MAKILSNQDNTGTIVASGDITTSGGKLRVTTSAGDEGGEIFLNKATTNTTIVSGVNIDVHQNRLRFWEDGGTNRGFYLTITDGASSVGTNLASGGTAVDSLNPFLLMGA